MKVIQRPALASALLLLRSVGWLLLRPLAWLVPRRADLVAFYGRDGGRFLDNCKHMFCAGSAQVVPGIETVYIAHSDALVGLIGAHGRRAVRKGSLAEFMLWLRAGTIVVDSVDWADGFRFAASQGARVVQLWHGIPLKHVQLARVRARPRRWFPMEWAYRLYLRASGRLRPVGWLLSTSPFVTEHAFSRSFLYQSVSHAGYPRNDAFFDDAPLRRLNVDQKAVDLVHARRRHGASVGVYAPTFRNSLADPFAQGELDLEALSAAATAVDTVLLVKLHPWMHGHLRSADHPGLVFVAPDSDIYPLLRDTDFLVTDYSSIFFDYLLLDRPVIFFPYDLERYLRQERDMYFEYADVTPGQKVFDMQGLEAAMREALADPSVGSEARDRIRRKVFSHPHGSAAERLYRELFPQASGIAGAGTRH